MEEKGISPIIATILLIAVTAVAAGVIAAYVSGLYVTPPSVIAGTADGYVYDRDNNTGETNYQNGKVVIIATLTSGRLRDVTDPDRGFNITLTNPETGWSVTLTQEDLTTPQSDRPYYSGKGATVTFAATLEDNKDKPNYGSIVTHASETAPAVKVMIPLSAGDDWLGGSAIILIDNLVDSGVENPEDPGSVFWDEEHTIYIEFSGRDSLSLTGYDGAYLLGQARP